MYTLVNAGPNRRVIPSAFGPVVLGPRETKHDVILNDGTAKFIRRGQMRGDKLSITTANAQKQAVLLACQDIKRGFRMVRPSDSAMTKLLAEQRGVEAQVDRDELAEAERVTESAPVSPAAAAMTDPRNAKIAKLLEAADRLTPPQLRGEAKKVLGPAFPGGNIGRRQIEGLLEKALKDGLHPANAD